jgi:hypothetical protein
MSQISCLTCHDPSLILVVIWFSTTKTQETRFQMIINENVWHNLENILSKATTLWFEVLPLKLVWRSYGFTKSQDWLFENFETFIWGSLTTFYHLDVVFIINHKLYYIKEIGVSKKAWIVWIKWVWVAQN